MNDLAYLDPPIEVLAASPRLDMILSRLRSGRMRPFRADFPISRASSEALLVDTESLDRETLDHFIQNAGETVRPILVLGDPGQLPPISGGGFFTEHEPDHLLTEIHRQARDNPIIQLALDVREGRAGRAAATTDEVAMASCLPPGCSGGGG